MHVDPNDNFLQLANDNFLQLDLTDGIWGVKGSIPQ
jgi:hypothetical protein